MKKRKKNYVLTQKVDTPEGAAIVLVYGELWEDGFVDGLRIQRVGLSRDGGRILAHGPEMLSTLSVPYARTKFFNLGWAICSPEDHYDEALGIHLAKRRFSMSPLSTQSGNLLTDDMNLAILQNELDFIVNNFNKFYRRTGSSVNEEEKVEFVEDDYVLATTEAPEGAEEYYKLGRVEKTVGDDELKLFWVVEVAKSKDGVSTRSYRTGDNIVVKKCDFRKATEKELDEINKSLSNFEAGYLT